MKTTRIISSAIVMSIFIAIAIAIGYWIKHNLYKLGLSDNLNIVITLLACFFVAALLIPCVKTICKIWNEG